VTRASDFAGVSRGATKPVDLLKPRHSLVPTGRHFGRGIESFDLGLVGGLGVEFGRALIEARYTHGLLRINTDDNEPNDRLNNRVFSVTMGFRFR
jgi:hypothetical protein